MANSKEHVVKSKAKPGLLPEKLKSTKLSDLVQSVNILINQINNGEDHSEGHVTPERVIKTLVRGLGSSNVQVQKNYFAALVTLMKLLESLGLPQFSAKHVLSVVESELHIAGNLPVGKREEGEILMGKVLVFGALVRSGALISAAVDDQVAAVTQLLQDVKGKSYLPLIGDPFIIEYLKQVDESVFEEAVWPCLLREVAPGPSQTLLMYHVLLTCEERFPSIVSAKVLKEALNTPRVLSGTTVQPLLSALKNDFKLKALNHSAYSDIFRHLASAPEGVLQSFWLQVETELLVDSTSVNKQIMAIKFFSLIIQQFQSASQVIGLLTPKLLSWFMKKHKVASRSQNILNKDCKEALDNLYKLCVKEDSSKTILTIIKKLLFDTGNILFEQFSGTRVIQQLMSHLKEKGVVKLAAMLRAVITSSSSATEHNDSQTSTRPWHNTEKLYTVHLFCRLLSLKAVQANMGWRLEQLTFLYDMGFFPASNIGVELAGLIRESFFGCLNHKLPNLVDLRNILAGLVEHINGRLDQGDQLRIKVPSEMLPAWKKMYATAKQIEDDKKHKKEQWVTAVFQTMFYHIGLHLFKEVAFATDVLQELHSVYERVGSNDSAAEEPHWTEVVVEMFLSLLSRNSQLHRHLIGCIFSHFCPIMIPQNIHQILQVMDPNSDTNALLSSLDPDSESSSDEKESGDEEDEGDDKESSDDGMSDEQEEPEDEKVSDRLRRAVFEALGENGALTDVESVDMDNMDEDEAARVDRALSEAFKANRQIKSKKQSSYAKALTHFRLRVLDLIEVWLASEPPLDLLVDTLLRLVSLLEHCLVDRHQEPLEIRLRSIIKKLTNTKKYDVSDCKSLHLGSILKTLLEKGDRTTTVYMSISEELTCCTLFMVKADQLLGERDEEEGSVTVPSVLKDIVKSFFLQRDCLLTVKLFERLFRLNVPYIFSLASKLPTYVFDPNVHPFRKGKALMFLMAFWKSNRILSETNEEHMDILRKMSKRMYKGSVKMMEEPVGRVQLKFVLLLKKALEIIHKKGWLTDIDWPQHFQSMADFQRTHVKKPESKKNKKVNGHKEVVTEEMEVESANEEPNTESEEEADEEEMDAADEDTGGSEEEDTNSGEEKEETVQKSEDPPSESEQIEKKSKKKAKKKRSHETQLLKNTSKRLRLETMGAGLEENVFSNYKLLANNVTPPSPER